MNTKNFFLAVALLLMMTSIFSQEGTAGPLTWRLDNGTLTISGNGEMPNYIPCSSPWDPYIDSIHTVEITAGVSSIGDNAFLLCWYLTSVSISNTVTHIGVSAFSLCSRLTSVIIPNSVTKIDDRVFTGCYSLASIEVNNNNSHYVSKNGVLFNKNKTAIIACPARLSGTYIIPNSVNRIEEAAFSDCDSLVSIIIPNSVTDIGFGAFSGCKSLISIIIPNQVKNIPSHTFFECINLTSITIPKSVISIADNAFPYCKSLISIEIADENIIYSSENGVLFDKNKTTLILYPEGRAGAYTIPNGVICIGEGSFANCINLNFITIPNSVTSIEKAAFFACFNLRSIIFSNNLKNIDQWAFAHCYNLTAINLPSSLEIIGSYAFAVCKNINSITNCNTVPIYIDSNIFSGVNTKASILKVPSNSASAYKEAAIWKEFKIRQYAKTKNEINNNKISKVDKEKSLKYRKIKKIKN